MPHDYFLILTPDLRPPLKKLLFPIQQPGENFNCRMGTLFFSCSIFVAIFFGKKRKKKMRPPEWPQFRLTAGQETNVFLRVAIESEASDECPLASRLLSSGRIQRCVSLYELRYTLRFIYLVQKIRLRDISITTV